MGKFVIRQVATGWKFNLKADNGAVIAVSEVYDSQAACRKGVESVRKAASTEKLEDQTVEGVRPCPIPNTRSIKTGRGSTGSV